MTQRRELLLGALAGMVLPAYAQQPNYPDKPLRLVVAYQAGGSLDGLARILAEPLGRRLGQPVLVDNRTGAGGIIGTDHAAKSAPDGYTLLLSPPAALAANVFLYRRLPYDPRTELRMVSDVAFSRTVLVVHPSVPATDVKSLIAAIQAAPNKYALGSWGAGTQPHQVQAYLAKTYDAQTVHTPYRGEAGMIADLLSGTIQMTVATVSTMRQYVQAGKLRALAVIGPQRAAGMPDVPTFTELGYPDEVFKFMSALTVAMPAKTPEAIVTKLAQAISATVNEPDVRRRIEETGSEPVGNLPAQAAKNYQDLLLITQRLIEMTGVTLD